MGQKWFLPPWGMRTHRGRLVSRRWLRKASGCSLLSEGYQPQGSLSGELISQHVPPPGLSTKI